MQMLGQAHRSHQQSRAWQASQFRQAGQLRSDWACCGAAPEGAACFLRHSTCVASLMVCGSTLRLCILAGFERNEQQTAFSLPGDWKVVEEALPLYRGGPLGDSSPPVRLLMTRWTASTVARKPSTRPLHTPTWHTHSTSLSTQMSPWRTALASVVRREHVAQYRSVPVQGYQQHVAGKDPHMRSTWPRLRTARTIMSERLSRLWLSRDSPPCREAVADGSTGASLHRSTAGPTAERPCHSAFQKKEVLGATGHHAAILGRESSPGRDQTRLSVQLPSRRGSQSHGRHSSSPGMGLRKTEGPRT